jgi:4-amino-4-deoxy-L-arabinose transferase-like glycosyltransferase
MTAEDHEALSASLLRLTARQVALFVALWALLLMVVVGLWHPTPLYTAETDLIGEYVPAARELMSGQINLAHYTFKGPGYPLLLAGAARLFGGDPALAARYLGPLTSAIAVWAAYLLAALTLGEGIGAFTALALLVSPITVRYAIEAGTDAPALAFMLLSTWVVVARKGRLAMLVAGLVAGFAVLTRSNAAFLLPCAAATLLLGPRRISSLGMYALGAVIPLATWAAVASRVGPIPVDRNYLNVAWELYGHGVPWDTFQVTIGAQFHTMREVLMYAPLRALTRVAWNLVYFRARDWSELVTPWFGMFAFPGLILMIRSSRTRAWSLHVAACGIVLAAVFYNPRFALYLLPFYLASAGLALTWCSARLKAALTNSKFGSLSARAVPVVGFLVLAVSATMATASAVGMLASAPHEVRLAGRVLKSMGLSGQSIVARKPHVAYFADMKQVAFPGDVPLWRLSAWARSAGTRYLFFSGIEQVMRPNLAVLADSALSLPGFEQILWRRVDASRFYAVYRLTEVGTDSVAFAARYRDALYAFDRNHPQQGSRLFVAVQLLDLGSPAEALARLNSIGAAGDRDPAVQRYRSIALLDLGQWDEAAQACNKSMNLGGPTAWLWAQLGRIAMHQGKTSDAEKCFANAVALEPASVYYLEQIGLCRISRRDFAGAAGAFESCLRLSPADVRIRREAMGAWQLAGNSSRVQQLYAEGVQAGLAPAPLLNGAGASD